MSRGKAKPPRRPEPLADYSRVRFHLRGRFMVANHFYGLNDDKHLYAVHGGQHPTTFLTLRNALACAASYQHNNKFRERFTPPRQLEPPGFVMLFDPHALVVVHPDDAIDARPGLPDRITDIEFAERQCQLWGQRAERLRQYEEIPFSDKPMTTLETSP